MDDEKCRLQDKLQNISRSMSSLISFVTKRTNKLPFNNHRCCPTVIKFQ